MCHNHSHLIANLAGEDTSGDVPVLTFVLHNPELVIEAPRPGRAKISLITSGLLYVPSWVMTGSSASTSPEMEAHSTCLYLLPAGDMTITRQVLASAFSFFGTSPTEPSR